MMDIKLYVKENNRIKLCLFDGDKKLSCLEWRDENDLSRSLLNNLDKLLRKNKVELDPHTNFCAEDTPPKAKHNSSLYKRREKVACGIGVGVDKISEYKIISDVPRKWTSVRIAEITFETLGIAKKNDL